MNVFIISFVVEMNYYVKKDMAPMDDMDTARTNIILNLHTLIDQDASVSENTKK